MALGVLSAFRRLAVQSASTSGEAGSSLPLNSLIRNKLNAIFNRGSLSASQRPLATAAPPQTTATAAPTAAAVAAGQQPQYRRVPFVREDLSLVMQEVPDFKYYYIGNEAPSAYPYKDVPMDQPILNPDEFPEYVQPSGAVEYSKLDNGLRIASVDRGGLVSSLGLFVNTGSRWEDVSNSGVSHMLQLLAFHSTAHLSFLRTIKTIEVLGASAACVAGREQIVYSAECVREKMPLLLPLLTGNVLFPRLLPWEISANKNKLIQMKQKIESQPDQCVSEMLHQTAWHNNTLGLKLFATEKSLQHYDANTIRQFILDHFSPENMVCVGVNVNHEEFSRWVMRAFVDYNAVPNKPRKYIQPIYTGGDSRVEALAPHAHIAVAFETPGGWNGGDLVTYSVLQTLMGGGGAFSTGGPGKGMYTRLYLNVLNKYDWVESAMAFNTQYTDTGLFGLYMLANPNKASSAVKVMAEQFAGMTRVTAEELQRAKNSIKSSIYMNLENRGIVMEDIGRQLLMSGRVISPAEFCRAIDNVKEADIRRVAEKMFSKPPTVVAYGDICSVPHYEEIRAALRAAGVGK
ncbi:mitochondrial-processing peptidase alpha subunit, putative [Eimeria tenella]|uniref:Mitochondrial-processing peptidase alpha subunit, putative n=2 Tax=Eimeria tenella TaxID=5802 RepID=U6KH88_EIMTE|nr:mitochondrial-processing peptidase alpha subunit, putative [Eimeria tenella]CDJ37319.1 mitochondrial-processing peptidase alpha subunit, putative [Eimeria tenella]|eukprot:XP_013228157.1 mitochondrial-processing peptidase alpha subunit, putative [Eimeria tenella]